MPIGTILIIFIAVALVSLAIVDIKNNINDISGYKSVQAKCKDTKEEKVPIDEEDIYLGTVTKYTTTFEYEYEGHKEVGQYTSEKPHRVIIGNDYTMYVNPNREFSLISQSDYANSLFGLCKYIVFAGFAFIIWIFIYGY